MKKHDPIYTVPEVISSTILETLKRKNPEFFSSDEYEKKLSDAFQQMLHEINRGFMYLNEHCTEHHLCILGPELINNYAKKIS